MAAKTYRIFSITLYDFSDTLNFNDILLRVSSHKLKYFYIKHTAEKEELKDHYHLVIYFDIPTTLKNVSNLLEINENSIKIMDETGKRYTLKKSVGYLLHFNNSEKIQYKFEDIKTNIYDTIKKYYDILVIPNSEKKELAEILAFIEDNHIKTTYALVYWCIENDYLKTLKKYNYLLKNIVYENRLF